MQGPTNSGKTYTGLRIAHGLIAPALERKGIDPNLEEISKRIAVIDTERGRAKYYAERDDLPMDTGKFYWMELSPPYTPKKYMEAAREAAELVGEDGVVFIDSLTHAWKGEGGVLDIKQRIQKQSNRDSYSAWDEAGKIQNQLIDTILSINAHTIVTLRSKHKHVYEEVEKNGKTKTIIKQVGEKPEQRDDTEYEFDVGFALEKEHNTATIIKDTTFLRSIADEDNNIGIITEYLGEILYKWLNEGLDASQILEEERVRKIDEIKNMAKQDNSVKNYYKQQLHPGRKADDLSLMEARDTLKQLYKFKEEQKTTKGEDY